MKMSKLALSAMIASACFAGTAFGQSNRTAPRYYPASYYSYYQDGAAPAPIASASDQAPSASTSCCDNTSACDVANLCNGTGSCDSMSACGCGDPSCDGGGCGKCGCGKGGLLGLGLIGSGRKLDDPWKLFPNGIGNTGINIGGWTDMGYHTRSTPNNFNTYPHKVQLQQQWFWAEKVANGSEGLGLGGRIDYLYGTDAPDTQSFGGPATSWDNPWDNPAGNNLGYGHALPQVYGEVAYDKLSAKIGHFFTIVGNEVVQATGNFFYSRQFTFYNAEPFTHTGVLTTYNIDDDTQIYNGWVAGWDSGFTDNGDAYLGGFKHKISDTLSCLYSTCMGRMGDSNVGVQERGNIHSFILTASLTDKLTYISQTDSLYSKNVGGTQQRNTFGNINYLLYKVNDRVTLGQRFEWFNYGGANFGGVRNNDLYNFTTGVNLRASANLLFRPEVRWVWDESRFGFNAGNVPSATVFGGDMLFTF
jgi:hypothetical protein